MSCSYCGTKCRAVRYCTKECQQRDWRFHKKVCVKDPDARKHMFSETAITRVLSRATADVPGTPDDARCYICLEAGGRHLMRGCVCRGAAGFVHVACLVDYAATTDDDATGVP